MGYLKSRKNRFRQTGRRRKPNIRNGSPIRRFLTCVGHDTIGPGGHNIMTAYKMFWWGGQGQGFHGGSDGSVQI